MANSQSYSTEIIRYKISPDRQADFLKAYTEAGRYLQESSYCLGYEVIQGEEEPTNFIVTIYWTSSEEHINGFRKSSQFGPFLALIRQYYNNIEEMKHYVSKTKWNRNRL